MNVKFKSHVTFCSFRIIICAILENVYRTMHLAQQPNATEGMDLKKSEAQFERQSLHQAAVEEEISHNVDMVDENPWFFPPVMHGLPPLLVSPRGRDSIEKIRILAESARVITSRPPGSLSFLQLNREKYVDSTLELFSARSWTWNLIIFDCKFSLVLVNNLFTVDYLIVHPIVPRSLKECHSKGLVLT